MTDSLNRHGLTMQVQRGYRIEAGQMLNTPDPQTDNQTIGVSKSTAEEGR